MRWLDLIQRDLVNVFQCKLLYRVSFQFQTVLHADFQCIFLSYFIMDCWDINHFSIAVPTGYLLFHHVVIKLQSCFLYVSCYQITHLFERNIKWAAWWFFKKLKMFCTLRGMVSGYQAYCQKIVIWKGVNRNKLQVDNL